MTFFLMSFSSGLTQAQVAELILPELAEIAGTLEPQQSSQEKAPTEEEGRKPEEEITPAIARQPLENGDQHKPKGWWTYAQ